MKARLDLQEYVNGILQGDRVVLAKAITLVESELPSDRALADRLLEEVLSKTGNSIRVGITGVPGVGKSTFIEAFGKYVTGTLKKKIAVLTVDPSSPLTKGSILGDKTRMEDLAKNPLAFIRPSSSGEALGGITHRTREAIHLCEAAGFEVMLVETVGVGQSETTVKKSVDFFLLLMLAGAGDELQGIKKGIMEMADTIAITKADGDNKRKAAEAQAEYQHALHLLQRNETEWIPRVVTCSAIAGEGIDALWNILLEFKHTLTKNGHFDSMRRQQQVEWMRECFDQLLKMRIQKSPQYLEQLKKNELKVLNKEITPQLAAQNLLEELIKGLR
ncbi:MAG: methylmalonyl Co-A mutase-associated GTPase MeaB [Cyclobacteriaceae bacterium]|nr:methylmalonyl Co-A mutase-associated GTPase MeaB [Cyclobacteriaceae bacterium]UYN87414.1 MAG: methylmalonyl Co-A mutase-associated GTPase MeaB [Cyclobacteriaceae bacterium]